MKTYGAAWGTLLKVVSALGAALLIAVAAPAMLYSTGFARWTGFLPVLILLGTALFLIRGYSITADAVLVHRLMWPTRLPTAGLKSVQFEPEVMKCSIRLFGNGGLFSFSGLYRNRSLGKYRAFVTDLHRTVVLRYANRTVVLSPERPEEFVQELCQRARATGAST